MEKINAWNHERRLEVAGPDTIAFDAITTGNYGGFDVWLGPGADPDGVATIETNHGTLAVHRTDIGIGDTAMEAGGLDRRVRVFRLPEMLTAREMRAAVRIPLREEGDNPLWISVYTEDGFQAWSSPIFAFR